MAAGGLVPDPIMIELVEERVQRNDCKNGFILDGFPRTANQAEALDNLLKSLKIGISVVFNITVESDEFILDRISGRRICRSCGKIWYLKNIPPPSENTCSCGGELYQRKDDNPDVMRQRLKTYREETEGVLSFYGDKGLLVDVMAEGEPEIWCGPITEKIDAILLQDSGLSALRRNLTLPKESINIAEIMIAICGTNSKVRVINQLGLDVKVAANREQLIASLEGIINSAEQVEINLSRDGNRVKIEMSADGKGVSDEAAEALLYAIKDAGGEIKVDSLTEDEYEKIKLPEHLRHPFDEEDMQVAKEFYPVIEKYMNNLIATIDRVIDELKKPEQLNSVNLRDAYESGVDVELKGSLGNILRKYWKSAHPKYYKYAFRPFDHIVGDIKAVLPNSIYPLIKKLNINTFRKGDEEIVLNIFLGRKIYSQIALEVFRRAANNKQRTTPGTTFTVYLPIAEDTLSRNSTSSFL